MMSWSFTVSVDLLEWTDDIRFFYSIDNRLCESNTVLQNQCTKLDQDVNHLRVANASLEKASGATSVRLELNEAWPLHTWLFHSSVELFNVNNKLQATNDELVTHLREKSEVSATWWISRSIRSCHLACSGSTTIESCIGRNPPETSQRRNQVRSLVTILLHVPSPYMIVSERNSINQKMMNYERNWGPQKSKSMTWHKRNK